MTLVETLLVVALFGTMCALVVPRLRWGQDLAATGRQVIGAIYSLQAQAAATQQRMRLYIDLDAASYWMVTADGGEERPSLDESLAARTPLPAGMRFTEVSTGRTKHIGMGQAYFEVSPTGRIDPGSLRLADADAQILTIRIQSITGRILVSDDGLDAPIPEPVPERIRRWVIPLATGF